MKLSKVAFLLRKSVAVKSAVSPLIYCREMGNTWLHANQGGYKLSCCDSTARQLEIVSLKNPDCDNVWITMTSHVILAKNRTSKFL